MTGDAMKTAAPRIGADCSHFRTTGESRTMVGESRTTVGDSRTIVGESRTTVRERNVGLMNERGVAR